MNCVNLLAALSIPPFPVVEDGERMVVAEVFLRPRHERDRRDFPDRLRVVALASSQAGIALMGQQKGTVVAITGCLRCGSGSRYTIPELFADQISVTSRGTLPSRVAINATLEDKDDQCAEGTAEASDSEL